MNKEYVSWARLDESIFGYKFYKHYYGYVRENTERGTSIVDVEFIQKTVTLEKEIKCGLFNLSRKTKIECVTLLFDCKKGIVQELKSNVATRENRDELLEKEKGQIERLIKFMDKGYWPRDIDMLPYLTCIINKENKEKEEDGGEKKSQSTQDETDI